MITWGRLTDLVRRGKRLDYESTLFFVFSDKDTQIFAVDLNTGDPNDGEKGQLFLQGVDSKGIRLDVTGGDYALSTVKLKQRLGLPFDRVTLYQEGDFYGSWEFIQKGDSFVLRADTFKEGEDLQDRWGSDIIGLTDESIQKLTNEVLPEIIERILSELL